MNPNIVEAGIATRLKPGNQNSKGHGRPPTKLISEALRNRLENGYADKISDEVIKLALKSKHQSVRLAAADSIADRTEGRPVQASVIGVGAIDADTAKRLAELAELLVPKSPE